VMVRSDLEAPITGASCQAKYGSAVPAAKGRRGPQHYAAVAAMVGIALVAFACFLYTAPVGPVMMESAAEKALKLEMSKRKYDSAKQRVARLHTEFDQLKAQLEGQVKSLDQARGDLVTEIKSAEGVPVKQKAEAETKDPLAQFASADIDFGAQPRVDTTAPFVTHLRDAASALAAAGTTNDAADAAKHALSYTQQVASRVGDLADQSEKQAEKIVDAARLTQEAKDAMRAALEQSSQIVDYNTHAAQAVAQDSGFVTTAAQTISGYLHNIFHDSQAVHQASIAAVKHMNDDVTAADHAVSEIEADAREAYDVLTHISAADKAATGFAKHARAAAVTAATAANGALKGERAAMVGGLKAISSAHSAKAGAQAAMEYARAAQAAVHPYVYGQVPASYGAMSPQGTVVDVGAPEAGAPVAEAKDLVDSVVILMQQLTNALETNGHDCDKVRQILTYYQAQMARYHVEGQGLAGKLSEEDMSLIEQYAQTQVGAFAGNLEAAVRTTSSTCNLPVSAFIPDASIGIEETSSMAAKDPMSAKANVLKSELRGIAAARMAVDANRAHKSARKQKAASQIDAAVAAEQHRIAELRKQVASLQAEKARLHQQK
jgi:hypothetical protein